MHKWTIITLAANAENVSESGSGSMLVLVNGSARCEHCIQSQEAGTTTGIGTETGIGTGTETGTETEIGTETETAITTGTGIGTVAMIVTGTEAATGTRIGTVPCGHYIQWQQSKTATGPMVGPCGHCIPSWMSETVAASGGANAAQTMTGTVLVNASQISSTAATETVQAESLPVADAMPCLRAVGATAAGAPRAMSPTPAAFVSIMSTAASAATAVAANEAY
mmetsp:Transcript_27857/g.82604  ORF Transcript_27857/g.82604 Transcript_27857/m.82604 type:complete len:224 (-) Transcript_27857:1569-2240(-)